MSSTKVPRTKNTFVMSVMTSTDENDPHYWPRVAGEFQHQLSHPAAGIEVVTHGVTLHVVGENTSGESLPDVYAVGTIWHRGEDITHLLRRKKVAEIAALATEQRS